MDVNAVESFVYVILMRILGVVGIIGNLVVLLVLLRSSLKESSYVYLTAMTFLDILVNALALGIGFVRCKNCELSAEQTSTGAIFERLVFIPGINLAATASLWTVLAMAIERYVFVAYPLHGKIYCRRRTAKLVISFISVASVALNTPRFLVHQVPSSVTSTTVENDSLPDAGRPPMPIQADVVSAKDYFLAVTICEALSFAALVYFNLRLIGLLRTNNRSRRTIVASFRNEIFAAIRARDEVRLSVTLSAVVALAVFTNAFTLLASEPLGLLIYGDDYKRSDVYRVFVLVGDVAVLASSSFNFVIYGVFNSRFKREFRRVYCSWSSWTSCCFCFHKRPELTQSMNHFAERRAATVYSI